MVETTCKHWIPHRPGRGRFNTRIQGHALKKSVWVCKACRAWHRAAEQTAKGRPAGCKQCQGKDFFFFDSGGEAQRFMALWFALDGGRIEALEHHPRFPLLVVDARTGKPVQIGYYEADSKYVENGLVVVEDFKPKDPRAQDPVFKLKRRIIEATHGFTISVVS